MTENVIIRKGTRDDIPALLNLIKELAAYEKAPDEVTVTSEILLEDGFGEDPVFSFMIAEKDDKTAGIALYYEKYSTWKGRCMFLEDIVIAEKFRRRGIGTMLFLEVAAVAKQKNYERMEWQVLDWNEPAIQFYKKLGSQLDPTWINCKLTKDQLRNI